MSQIRQANDEAGKNFFEPATIRFFDSKIGRTIYQGPGGVYFLTSEQFHGSQGSAPRRWTVRVFDPELGNVGTFGEHGGFAGPDSARRAAKAAAKGES